MYFPSQSIFVVEKIINFEQLKGRSEWSSQAMEMVAGARWQFDPYGIFVFAPAYGRKDIFPLQGDYTRVRNRVFFQGMITLSVSASIASTWCKGDIDFDIDPPIMNMEWRNDSSTAAMIIDSLFNSHLSSAYRTTLILRQV